MPRLIGLPAALCALILCAGLALTGASAEARPVAHAATTCDDSSVGSLGSDNYFTGITTKHASCMTALRVAVGWQACRLKRGGVTGHCHSKVVGFTCRETRPKAFAGPISFGGVVSCKRGTATVAYSYQQRTH
ncbi:MAG: hypothetical protein ACR2KV_16080 [Solirubrobacteraceae bacterium]